MMPSTIMDLRGFPSFSSSSSSSFWSDGIPLPTRRDVELSKPDTMPDQHDIRSEIDSSTLEKNVAVEFQLQKLPDHPRSVLMHENKMSCSLNMHATGVERAVDQLTLAAPINHAPQTKSTSNKQTSSFLAENGPANMMVTQYENNLFSSSLSELINRKLKISSNSVLYGYSVNSLAANFEEEAPFEYLAESEAQTIGNFLPSDDGLFTGVIDGLYDVNQTSGGDSVEELDFFSSIGGLDLGDDGCTAQSDSHFPGGVSNSQLGVHSALITGEHPYGEHPSRKLLVRNISSGVEDSELRDLFKRYGDICRLYTACKHCGFVIIYYFDIRAASYAMKNLQNRLLRHQKLDIHYSIPTDNPSEENFDLDTLVLDLDPTVSNDELLETFGVYGEIKEIHEKGSHHKLVKFFDIRAAKAAFQALNSNDIGGKEVKLEPSRPGGSNKCSLQQIPSELEQDKCGLYLQLSSPPNNSVTGFSAFGSAGNGSPSLPGCHYTWSNSYCSPPSGMMWPNSPSFVNDVSVAHPTPQLHGLPIVPPAMPNTVFPTNNHLVVSAPTVSPFWDRRCAYAGECLESSGFNPGSLESMGISNNSHHSIGFVSWNLFPCVGGYHIDLHLPHEVLGLQPDHQGPVMFPGCGQMIPMVNSFNCPTERPRSCRKEGTINQADKKQYELDINRIVQGGDSRTTLMIKNIPNKYTSKMLLAAIDEHHKGTYDFIYLPIDFKNKCNVGHAFINMTGPSHIVPFYQAFNGKKWEKFNSEKVASLAYARIQGKAALIAHFQNSSLINEDQQCRPILFNTDGPNAGDQVPFPIGVNVRRRPAKRMTMTREEDSLQGSPNLANRDDS